MPDHWHLEQILTLPSIPGIYIIKQLHTRVQWDSQHGYVEADIAWDTQKQK